MLRTFVSVFLLKLLQFNNYFGNYSDTETFAELTEKYLYIGRLLLHFSHSLPQNVQDITLLEPGNLRDLAVGELGCYNLLNVYEKM